MKGSGSIQIIPDPDPGPAQNLRIGRKSTYRISFRAFERQIWS
jgi:hypothetical protein